MHIGQPFTRPAPFGGTQPVSADVEPFDRRELDDMAFQNLKPGLYAVARNDEGFIIQMSKIELETGELGHLKELKPVMVLDAEEHYGIER